MGTPKSCLQGQSAQIQIKYIQRHDDRQSLWGLSEKLRQKLKEGNICPLDTDRNREKWFPRKKLVQTFGQAK